MRISFYFSASVFSLSALFISISAPAMSDSAQPQMSNVLLANASESLYLGEGDNKIISLPFRPKIISVGKKEIADYTLDDKGSVVIYAKARGATNIVARDFTGKKQFSISIVVGPNASTFNSYINSVEPGGDITFEHLSNGKFVASGHASSYANKKRICDYLSSSLEKIENAGGDHKKNTNNNIAESAPFLQLDSYQAPDFVCDISTQKQRELINVSIKMLEVSDSLVRKLGINWEDSLNTNNVFRLGRGFGSIEGFVQALLVNDKTKLLAEPNISVLAGQRAQFKAGGELPLVSVDREGNQSVTFKPYGVLLQMGADIESSGEIKVGINSEISRLDPSNSYEMLNGARFFALSTQSAATTLLVNDGETFVLGGLSSYQISNRDNGVPFLSKIPVLSAAFNHVDERKENKQVIIVATVKKIDSVGEKSVKYKTIPIDSLAKKLLGFSGYDIEKMNEVGIDELTSGMEMY